MIFLFRCGFLDEDAVLARILYGDDPNRSGSNSLFGSPKPDKPFDQSMIEAKIEEMRLKNLKEKEERLAAQEREKQELEAKRAKAEAKAERKRLLKEEKEAKALRLAEDANDMELDKTETDCAPPADTMAMINDDDEESELDKSLDAMSTSSAASSTITLYSAKNRSFQSDYVPPEKPEEEQPEQPSMLRQLINEMEEENRRRGLDPAYELEKLADRSPRGGFINRLSSAVAATVPDPGNLPCVSGFIESWNPFGTAKFFDTPPSTPDIQACRGYTLKSNVSIGKFYIHLAL